MRKHRITPGQAGFTMIEMVIATMMLLVLSFLVTNMIISGNAAQKYSDRQGRATEITQESLDDIASELQEAVRVFEDDMIGIAYLARLQPWSDAVAIASSRLPRFKPTGILEKDLVGSEATGNQLLFVRHAWADTYTCSSGTTYRLDVYRLVRYYMKVEGAGPHAKKPFGLNLVKWTSEPVVSSTQVDRISDPTDLAEVMLHLHDASPDDTGASHTPLNLIWALGQDPLDPGTFRQILSDGSLAAAPTTPRASVWEFERADRLSSKGLLYYRHHSVATNYFRAHRGVARFGIRDDTLNGIGFPHGFEIQVVGSAAARKLLIHLTTVSTNENGLRAAYDGQAVIVVREG